MVNILTRKLLGIYIAFYLTAFALNAQTNVSGGIFVNTTWTKVNSPYVVTDTVVVFPGITLTIQPGVIVKFDYHVVLEIRQAQLIAQGTLADSITFTSNSHSPSPGIWRGVHLKGGALVSQFKYCNFRYAGDGIYSQGNYTLSNSDFYSNTYGLYGGSTSPIDSCNFRYSVNYGIIGGGTFNYCRISNTQQRGLDGTGLVLNNCIVDSNQFGIYGLDNSIIRNCYFGYNQTAITSNNINGDNVITNTIIEFNSVVGLDIGNDERDTIMNCHIRNNGVGLNIGYGQNGIITKNNIEYNSVGIQLAVTGDSIYCNRICHNTAYDLKNMSSGNVFIPNNYWCTSDSISTEAVIYDAHDNVSLGIVYFMPIDSLCAPSTPTSVNEIQNIAYSVFPNPSNGVFAIQSEGEEIRSIEVFNLFGERIKCRLNSNSEIVDISSEPEGIYVVRIDTGKGIFNKKVLLLK